MRVLLIGGGGQLGHHLRTATPRGVTLEAPGRAELDLTDGASIERKIESLEPELVINAAAYTAVDRAESERAAAFAINADGPRLLAARLVPTGARLIQISTDFVFSGDQRSPYRPTDATGPLNAYGASKLAGEEAVFEVLAERALVVRTSWLYSVHGANFVLTMRRLLAEGRPVRVVADQTGSPTWAATLADAVWRWALGDATSGIRHWCDSGVATWHELAVAIAEEAASLGLLDKAAEVVPITTSEYPTAARRPVYSALDSSASAHELDLPAVPWRVALRGMLKSLNAAPDRDPEASGHIDSRM